MKPISSADLYQLIEQWNDRSRERDEELKRKKERESAIVVSRCTLAGPRFSGIKTFLKDVEFHFNDLKFEIDEEVGWFRAKYWIKITGPRKMVQEACDTIQRCIDRHNG